MADVTRESLVNTLEEIALLLELKGENPFKTRAYRNGAEVVQNFDGEIVGRAAANDLKGIKGIGEAVAALDMPIVSGNVSLYNETDGTAILPTPTICAVGLLKHTDDIIGCDVRDGHVALLLGETHGHLGQSALLAEVFNRVEGDAPPVDLVAEKAHGDFIRANRALIRACTDLSDGGLAMAAFELAESSGVIQM